MYSVLIVEDELLVSIGLRNMIDWNGLGMQVIGDAPNGEVAISLYKQHKPDLILTDIKMPVMDGIQLIEEIRREDSRTKIIILTAVQEFDSLHRAMRLGVTDYILKLTMSPQQMTDVILKVKAELDAEGRGGAAGFSDPAYQAEKLLEEYICSRAMSAEAFRAAAARMELALPEQGLVVCLLQTARSPAADAGADKVDRARFSAILRNLLAEQMEREGCGRLVWGQDSLFLLVFGLGSQPSLLKRQSALAAVLGRIRENVKTYLDAQITLALSTVADGYEQLPGLYTEARAALNESYYVNKLPYTTHNAPENRHSFAALLQGFQQAVEDNTQLEGAYRAVVTEGIQALHQLYGAPRQEVWELFERLVHWPAAHAHMEMERTFTLALETAYDVRGCTSLPQVITVFESYLRELSSARARSRQLSREVARAVQYIHDNYASEISLQMVADHVEMSANYLSSLFKKELEIGFVDYLNRLRIEKAGRLLLDTNLKTYEVAIRVGFSDESYFSRIFKRVKGVRPRDYKRADTLPGPEAPLP